jgi:hypothetical protein
LQFDKVRLETKINDMDEKMKWMSDRITRLVADALTTDMYRDESIRLGKEIVGLKNRINKLEEFNKYFHGSVYTDWV